jgi:hypothetical protein
MRIAFSHCGVEQVIRLADLRHRRGFLKCPQCNQCVTELDVSDARQWVEQQVARKRGLLRQGKLGTRKQSARQSDEQIDRDGLAAELVACVLLCPGRFETWRRAAERGGGNRGRDLSAHWTGLDKPVEVKQTRYHDDRRGYLLVRPPRWTPGEMRPEYIDDAYYVLLHGEPYRYTISGWIDRDGLLAEGQLNPVPVAAGQRQCWGVHWSKLRPLEELAERRRTDARRTSIVAPLIDLASALWKLLATRISRG